MRNKTEDGVDHMRAG